MVRVTGEGKNQVLHINRGDDGFLNFYVTDPTGETYQFDSKDIVRFSIRQAPSKEAERLLVAESIGCANIRLHHKDIDMLEVGMYSADLELKKFDPTAVENPDDPDWQYIVTTLWPDIEADYVKSGTEKNWKNCIIEPEVTH